MRILLALALLAAAFVGALALASEKGGEVVVISTTDGRGVSHDTSLWIVDYRGSPYLRAGNRDSGWVHRLEKHSTIQMERNGHKATYLAVPDPQNTKTINMLMAQDYGLADELIGLVRNPAKTLAIRLERVGP